MSEDKGLGAVLEAAEAVSRTDHEAAVTAAREEGRQAGIAEGRKDTAGVATADALQAARVAGATAERERILAIQAHGVQGTEQLVAELVADGKTTADQAGARILAELKAQGPRMLAGLKGDEPKNPGAGSTASGAGVDTLTAQDASKQIAAEMKAAEEAGTPISFAEAGSRIRARQRTAA